MTSLRERPLGKTGVEIILDNDDGKPAGSIVVSKIRRNRGYIGYIFVRPEQRGGGYGSKLLEETESWAVKEELNEIIGKLIPTPGSEKPLSRLLQNNGYQIDGKGNVRKKL